MNARYLSSITSPVEYAMQCSQKAGTANAGLYAADLSSDTCSQDRTLWMYVASLSLHSEETGDEMEAAPGCQ